MRACLAVACVLLLGAGCAFASPFDQVPVGDGAYADCAFLAQSGIIDTCPAGDFAGTSPLTRYDFTMSLVRPMAALETLARDGRAGAALAPAARMNDGDRARVGNLLARLLEKFGDVLSLLGKDSAQAIVGARLFASPGYASRAGVTGADSAAGITYGAERTRLGLIYRTAEGAAAALPHIPLGGLGDTSVVGLASSRLPSGRANTDVAPMDRVASTDISLRRLRGSFEYGVTDNLSLSLAYEALVREGKGTELLDATSLRTLGVGYRLSPSASVKLNYHLINYADYAGPGLRLNDRMAEGELTVRF